MNLRILKALLLNLLAGLQIGLLPARAQPAPTEYQLKAAFLYNFIKFVQWPANTFATESAPITIGVLGENPFGNNLEATVKGKSIDGHPLSIKYFSSAKDPAVKSCQVIFICQSERKRMGEILSALKGTRLLTVSETETFIDDGGMINFVMENNKVRFEINEVAIRHSGLCISSKLLNLRKRKEGSP